MKRLVVFFSYIGTSYQGLQRTTKTASADLKTIQGILELGLKKVLRKDISLSISSRTDSGVHALESTAHFDIDDRDLPGGTNEITNHLNNWMEKWKADIRVKRVNEVNSDFQSRHHAYGRSYCYRIAVCKPGEVLNNVLPNNTSTSALPISDLYRCVAINQPFDTAAVAKACEIYLGTWNFRTFAMSSKEYKELPVDHSKFIKTLYRISFSQLNVDDERTVFDPVSNKFDYYDFNITSSGFLRRQVRRMVGALVSVGQGRCSTEHILTYLNDPTLEWDQKILILPADGLYLKEVHYKNMETISGSFS